MVGRRCVSLGVACIFDVLMTGYESTVVDGDISHIGGSHEPLDRL